MNKAYKMKTFAAAVQFNRDAIRLRTLSFPTVVIKQPAIICHTHHLSSDNSLSQLPLLPSSPQVVGGDPSFFIIIPSALKRAFIFFLPLPIPRTASLP
jgi:hypothetical protein